MAFERMAWRLVRSGFSFLALVVAVAVQAIDEPLVMDATVEGKPVQLVFDTGAGHMVLFRQSAERLGLKIIPSKQAQPLAPGSMPVDWTEELRVTVGKVEGKAAFAVLDMPDAMMSPGGGPIRRCCPCLGFCDAPLGRS